MRAPPDDAAGIEHDDLLGMAMVFTRWATIRTCCSGSPGEGGAQIRIGPEIERGKAIVEDEDFGVTDDRAGDRKPLALSARNV